LKLSPAERQIKEAIESGHNTINSIFTNTNWFDTKGQLKSFLYQMRVKKEMVNYDQTKKEFSWTGK
jgi:hypothetical protein